jgi:sodium/bile acid cotransporter 7
MKLRSWLAANWFLPSLGLAVLAAWLFPGLGSKGGVLMPEVTVKVAISVIFLFQGLGLDARAMLHGAGQWKLHMLVQCFTFLLFPAAGLMLDAMFGQFLPPSIRVGFLYLFVLPSTISTAVVYTMQAGGSTAAAVFNATLSSVMGVFLTPVWVGVLLAGVGGEAAAGYDVWSVLRQLFVLVLIPLGVGMLLRPMLRTRVDAHRKKLSNTSSALVLYMVFTAFCDSFAGGVWSTAEPVTLVLVLAAVAAIFGVSSWGAWAGAGALKLGRAERVTALFCAPQKTLATGVPMAQLLFADRSDIGLILLPLMLYHPLQLLVGGVLVDRLARRK